MWGEDNCGLTARQIRREGEGEQEEKESKANLKVSGCALFVCVWLV
jgi:hypothetical protein